MSDRSRDALQSSLHFFESAVSLEEKLDCDKRHSLRNEDAVALAAEATDAYMASCSALMSVMGQFKKTGRMHALLSKNIKFMMERIEGLQVLMQREGSIIKRKSLANREALVEQELAKKRDPTEGNEKDRTLVAREILDSEKSYVRALESLQNFYIIPLTSGTEPVLDMNEKINTFGNLEEILGLAQNFQKALQAKIDAWGPNQTLGDTFKQFAMFFKIYVMYTNSYHDGIIKARKLLDDNPVAKQIAQRAMEAGCQDIMSLMINPIQRLPRYVLLVERLRKKTSSTHPDAKFLESALKDVQVVADFVNETLRKHQENAKILEIQSALWTTRLGGVPVTLLEAGRQFIKEGKVQKIRKIGTLREVHLFLFSDILLYATSSKLWPGRYHYHNHLEFYGASDGYEEAKQLGASHANLKLAFKVTSQQAVRVFIPNTEAERQEWMRLINECATKKRELDDRRTSKRLSLHSLSDLHKSLQR